MGQRPATSSEGTGEEKPTSFLEERENDAPVKNNAIKTRTSVPEITEEDTEQRPEAEEGKNHTANGSSKEGAPISPEVEHALDILDQAISVVRGQSIAGKNCFKSSSVGDDLPISVLAAKASLFDDGDVPESSNNKLRLSPLEGSLHGDDHRLVQPCQ